MKSFKEIKDSLIYTIVYTIIIASILMVEWHGII